MITMNLEIDQFLSSLLSFNRAISLEKGNQDYFVERGKLFKEMKNYESAFRDFSMAIDLNPRIAEIWEMRGETNVALEKFDAACFDFKFAKQLGSTKGITNFKMYCK